MLAELDRLNAAAEVINELHKSGKITDGTWYDVNKALCSEKDLVLLKAAYEL